MYARRNSGVARVGAISSCHMEDFSPVIEAVSAEPGSTEDEPEHWINVGFARNTMMSVFGKLIDLVRAGKIRRFFLVGGADIPVGMRQGGLRLPLFLSRMSLPTRRLKDSRPAS